jgi:hypothetical protein
LPEDQRGRSRPQGIGFDIGAVEVEADFALSAVTPLDTTPGETIQTTITATSIDLLDTLVQLGLAAGAPPGFTVTFADTSLELAAGGTASTVADVKVGAGVTSGVYSFVVRGSTGLRERDAGVTVNVATTSASMARTIDTLRTAGCINSKGVAFAFKALLGIAKSLRDRGRERASSNILWVLSRVIEAQSGRHVVSSCEVDGQTIDPGDVLIAGVQDLLLAQATATPNPVTGSVMKSGLEVAGATVRLFLGKKLIASSMTDDTGFYYFTDTSQLTRGATYTVMVTGLPKGWKLPKNPVGSFKWDGSAVALGTAVLK